MKVDDMNRKCPRTLDKPLLMFGLEMEDLGLLGLIGGLGSLVFGPLIPGLCTIVGWFVLMHFKKGRPAGYLLHWLYAQGCDMPGLLLPINKVKHYGIFRKTSAS